VSAGVHGTPAARPDDRSARGGLASWALAAVLLASAAGAAPPPGADSRDAAGAADSAAAPAHRVVAYYFFMNQRCASCRKIEAWSREAIESAFSEELKDGRLVWRAVNVEAKGNAHFVKDYHLYTKSLILVDEHEGEQVRWSNLARVWELLPKKDAFFAYVQGEVRGYLSETS
jgi:hypothetical protein